MKIGLVYEHVEGGGAPFIVRNQVKFLIGNGHDVTLITTPSEICKAKELDPRLNVVPLLSPRGSMLSWVFRPMRFASLFFRERIQLVIIHSVRTACYVGLIAMLCGSRVIVVEHANPHVTAEHLSPRQRFFLGRLLRKSTVVCVSHGASSAFFKVFGKNAETIYNFENLSPRDGMTIASQRSHSIVSLGRLAPEKRVDLILDCFDIIGPFCDWDLHIYGDGSERDTLLQKANRSRFRSRIHFRGWNADVASVLENAGLFIMTSHYEGFGIALLEAMVMGVPSVAFDCPFGPREIAAEVGSAVLVPNGDIAELARAVQNLISNPTLRDRLGVAGATRGRVFSKDAHELRWLELIQEVGR